VEDIGASWFSRPRREWKEHSQRQRMRTKGRREPEGSKAGRRGKRHRLAIEKNFIGEGTNMQGAYIPRAGQLLDRVRRGAAKLLPGSAW